MVTIAGGHYLVPLVSLATENWDARARLGNAGVEQLYLAQQLSPNPDCSPPLYYSAAGSLIGVTGPVSFSQFPASDPELPGAFFMHRLSDEPHSFVLACYTQPDGSITVIPEQYRSMYYGGRTVIATYNLAEMYPPPLSLH
jgi:hypothetical protein